MIFGVNLVLQKENAVPDRIVACAATFDYPLNLCKGILLNKFPCLIDPVLDADDNDLLDLGISLEILDRVNDYRLTVNFKELLGDISPHSLPYTACQKDNVILHVLFLVELKKCVHEDLHVLLVSDCKSEPACESLLAAEDEDAVFFEKVCDLTACLVLRLDAYVAAF